MSNSKGTIIAAVIGAVATLLAAFFSANYGEQKMQKNLQNSIDKVTGDNNTININNIDDFIKDYQNTKVSNDRYAKQLEESEKELEDIKKQVGDVPDFKFKDLKLTIDGEEMPFDSTNSMVTIDGRDYFDKNFVDSLLGGNRELTIKENNAYIGRVIKDKVNLADKWLVDSTPGGYVEFQDSVTDSFGNMCANAIKFDGENSYAVFNLEEGYSLFKCRIALMEDVDSDINEQVIIKADNKVVYKSPSLNKTKKPFVKADIPIKNCSLLTIEFHSDGYGKGIISDASVYN